MKYLLDADVFIAAKNRYYPFDAVPAFWECIDMYVHKGILGIIDKVKEELARGKDELAGWVDKHLDLSLQTNISGIVAPYAGIIKWVESQPQFKQSAKADFASGADGLLIAYAKTSNCIVVTNETFNPDIKRKVPIPNVCRQFKVKYLNTFDFLRELGVKFVLLKEES